MSRWFALAPMGVLLALTVLFVGYALRHDPHVNPAALVGHAAPDIVLKPLDGGAPRPVRSRAVGPVLVNFFASWCAPCLEEEPALLALKAQGVPIIGVAYKDVREPGQPGAFLQQNGNPFSEVFLDPTGRAGVDFGISGVPETFVVTADGKVIAKRSGPLTPQDAESLAESLAR
ncbi:MAG TPA: redoxin family protein [Caulobacteraceae bacterium]|nr:redoxin family protein [Caulobacteraceae bacterium]